ncbi:cell surface protein [Brachyspira alvinipulli]|uniref:cell surface protein n=1 Tax=Brachyspira alvinipulli TaxID=84379 RepID=UPI000488C90F|nr:cell surface protein [Brachyspira alvinipulli]
MKKVLLTAMAILTLAGTSVFGMYGVDGNDWIGFLIHGNQLRARMDQLGFTLGNGTIKGTFGFRADTGWMGSILGGGQLGLMDSLALNATVSAGIGYTSDMIGVGVGYNFTYVDRYIQVHTPTLVLNALNNNLRLAVPIQVAVAEANDYPGYIDTKLKFTGVGFNQMELRYYTGIDAFNLIRLDVSYRNLTQETQFANNPASKGVYEDLALQLRLYFLNTTVGNVTVNPFLRIDYITMLKGNALASQMGKYSTIANSYNSIVYEYDAGSVYSVKPYTIKIKPVLSLAASSDIVSLYFEPSIGYAYSYSKYTTEGAILASSSKLENISHALTWGAYAEMYVRPVQDLEWYFEMDVNGNVNGNNTVANAQLPPVLFETTTGITWYLPSLGGDTAQ